jgi:hypothetical protein
MFVGYKGRVSRSLRYVFMFIYLFIYLLFPWFFRTIFDLYKSQDTCSSIIIVFVDVLLEIITFTQFMTKHQKRGFIIRKCRLINWMKESELISYAYLFQPVYKVTYFSLSQMPLDIRKENNGLRCFINKLSWPDCHPEQFLEIM